MATDIIRYYKMLVTVKGQGTQDASLWLWLKSPDYSTVSEFV